MKNTLTRLLAIAALLPLITLAQDELGVARYSDNGELYYPDNLDSWIHLGSSLGSDYNHEAFDPQNPGTIGVVQMEPGAYQHFREHGSYADGTMFLLSFYDAENNSDPQLQGFVQGALTAREIHLLDTERYQEGSAFFLLPGDGSETSAKIPDDSECIQCHTSEGDYRATFIQFYPTIRDLPRR